MGGPIEDEINSSGHFPKQKDDLKTVYFDFLKDFREYLSEYIRESVTELKIGETLVKGKIQIFDGVSRGKAIIKNQGKLVCYVSTSQLGGFRLDPGEKEEFYVNNPVFLTVLSGTTTVGFIKY